MFTTKNAAIASVVEDINIAFILKEEQRTVIKAFVDRKYVFAVLPTGFGKSLIYQLAVTTPLLRCYAPLL